MRPRSRNLGARIDHTAMVISEFKKWQVCQSIGKKGQVF